ncbi:phosphoenolpyruvate--protein phosphotransferase [Desulfolutivibrio sulfoxidireducens]|uniref:phosphoenolpyruvate--protein phosphotransferase n=1 Tax=Desulfolutivibrio sulfoxidireducens TaxID=2773299 RepID=UPI00159E7E60|nr:phosphoenolpyruvate--protein phosphotransferase [Desulfolutivibrio sulfoxidireducens]QLA17780.1 phosphoenolpyruvate--protein phosphotransferase [Desulfolutivibrio sulfoxidireducens]
MASVILKGIPVSAGISIGKAFFLNRSGHGPIPRQTLAPELFEPELARLARAFGQFREELVQVRERIPTELREHAHIIDSHLMILDDPKLQGAAGNYIRTLGINAEWALEKAVADLQRAFEALDNPYFRDRIQDVRMVSDRVQARLSGQTGDIKAVRNRVVLMADDLSPADTAAIEVDKIMSVVTAQGGKTSHTGILARTLGIPAVIGVNDLEEHVRDGRLVVVDGLRGSVLVDPDEDELAKFTDLKYQFEAYHASIMRGCHLPGETIDGYRVKVKANIELLEEVAAVIDNGGEGIGLYRTEYSYMNRRTLPTEEELTEEYFELASIMSPKKVTLRTLDAGADKFIALLGNPDERNPALGLRAIRLCMHHKDLFKTQLRAILRASTVGNVSVMFPMISGLREIRQAMSLLRTAQSELRYQGMSYDPEMPVGIMMELPSAVMIAEVLAREVDFFSIGTNDLIQYSLGIDRTNRYVSHMYQPLHPAVVRSIKHIVDAAHQAGIEVSLCGEMASDPFCVPILMGMQIDAISLNPQAIPGIKRIIRQATMDDCKKLLKEVLESTTVARTNRLVRDTIFQKFPDELMFFSSLLDQEEGMTG